MKTKNAVFLKTNLCAEYLHLQNVRKGKKERRKEETRLCGCEMSGRDLG
jgi:hypothetical protein